MSAISRTVTIGKGTKYVIFKGSWCIQFPEAVVLLQRKKAYALPNMVHYKFSLFYRSRNCCVQLEQTSVAKVSLYRIEKYLRILIN